MQMSPEKRRRLSVSNIMDVNFNGTTAEMLKIISDYDEVTGFNGAYNIREDSKCCPRGYCMHR